MSSSSGKFLPWFILILVTALILGAMAGYYYSAIYSVTKDIGESAKSVGKKSPKPVSDTVVSETTTDEYEGWQTYTNEKYNYTLRYPQDWGLIDYAYDKINSSVENKWEFVLIDKNEIAQNAVPYASEMPSSNFVMSAVAELGDMSSEDATASTIDIDGTEANQYTCATASEMTGEYYTIIQFEKDGQGYSINILNSDASGTHPADVDKIIESITF